MSGITVVKSGNESTGALLRRFSKRVQGSGIVRKVKNNRYYQRALSPAARKARALKGIAKREIRDEQIKLGKISENERRGRPGMVRRETTTSSSTEAKPEVVKSDVPYA